jgi:hypothetical protein
MKKTLLAALLLTPLFASAATELVTNGSFEDKVISNGTWTTVSTLAGWTGAPNIELRNNVAGNAFAGKNYVELDTGGNSSMFQNISTQAGAHYTLSFAYSARPSTGDTNDISVYWNNALITTKGGSNATGSHQWQVFNFDVVGGAGSLSQLKFAAAGRSDSLGGSLDAVSVTSAVPEPESYAMLLAGFGLMGLFARRRKAAIR